jgi:hypothetical protein
VAIEWVNDPAARSARLEAYRVVRLGPLDPYFTWAASSRAIEPDDWFPVLLQLKSGLDPDGVPLPNAARFTKMARELWSAWMRCAPWYESPAAGLHDTRFLTAWITPRFFDATDRNGRRAISTYVERFAFGMPVGQVPLDHLPLAPAAFPTSATTPSPPPTTDAAVIGVVDDGIAFAGERLRAADGRPRVRFFWDQRVPRTAPAFVPNLPVPYGIEWPAEVPVPKQAAGPESLVELFAASTFAGRLDEDAVYEAAGQDRLAVRARHGTHVLDVAAGEAAGEGANAGTRTQVVAVQLPDVVAGDPAGHLLEAHLFDAIRYIVDRADRAAQQAGATGPVPVVVNLSYGLLGGPHDGTSVLEAAMDELVAERESKTGAPLAIVVAAGNSALGRCHARVELQAGSGHTLEWFVPPDSEAPAFLEIWIGLAKPDLPAPAVSVRLVPPIATKNKAIPVGAGGYAELLDTTWGTTGTLSSKGLLATVDYVPETEPISGGSYYNERDMLLLTVFPTAGADPERAFAPAGVWTVEIENAAAGQDVEIHAWIRRNDSPFGFRTGGRQSRFVDDRYRVVDDAGRVVERDETGAHASAIQRSGTLNGIATGVSTVVVGALMDETGRPAPYTSSGPSVVQAAQEQPTRPSPSLSAVSDRSMARFGVLAAGTRGAATVAMNGTSVAAPSVARRLAEQFASGTSSTSAAIAAISSPQPAAKLAADAPRIGPRRLDASAGSPLPGWLAERAARR